MKMKAFLFGISIYLLLALGALLYVTPLPDLWLTVIAAVMVGPAMLGLARFMNGWLVPVLLMIGFVLIALDEFIVSAFDESLPLGVLIASSVARGLLLLAGVLLIVRQVIRTIWAKGKRLGVMGG